MLKWTFATAHSQVTRIDVPLDGGGGGAAAVAAAAAVVAAAAGSFQDGRPAR